MRPRPAPEPTGVLQLRRHDARTMILTDHRGVALPCQRSVAWSHDGPGERASVIVEFMIDGEDIVVSDQPVETGAGTLAEAAAAFAALSPENRVRFLAMHGLAVAHDGLNGRQVARFVETGSEAALLGIVEGRHPQERFAVLRPLSILRSPTPFAIPVEEFESPAWRRIG